MKCVVLASLVASVAAFAPANKVVSSSALKAAVPTFEDKPGAIPPIGYWDPLGLAKSEELFDQYRIAEVKHGRAAMLAVIGYIVPEVFRFDYQIAPGVSTAEVRNGVAALSDIPALGWIQIMFLLGFVDYTGILGDFEMGKPKLDDETMITRQNNEISNGRLAMLASLELLRHDSQNFVSPGFDGLDNLITGLPFIYE